MSPSGDGARGAEETGAFGACTAALSCARLDGESAAAGGSGGVPARAIDAPIGVSGDSRPAGSSPSFASPSTASR